MTTLFYRQAVRYCSIILILGIITACAPTRPEFDLTYKLIPVDAHWDNLPTPQMDAIVAKYQPTVDSLMNSVIGTSSTYMEANRPEAPLNNWAADAIKTESQREFARPIDFAVTNIGGLRNPIMQGDVTLGQIYSTFPFDNKLTLVTLKGSDVRQLFDIIASRNGEAVSKEVRFTIANDKATAITIAGEPLDDNRIYTIATIDYVANGGDHMTTFLKAIERIDSLTLMREAIIRHIQQETKAGRPLSAKWEGRIIKNSLEVK